MGRTKRISGLAALSVVVAVVLALVAAVALNGFIVMVIWGALASVFGFSTIGFGTGVVIALALSFVGGFFKKATS